MGQNFAPFPMRLWMHDMPYGIITLKTFDLKVLRAFNTSNLKAFRAFKVTILAIGIRL